MSFNRILKKIPGWGPQPINTLDSDAPAVSPAVSVAFRHPVHVDLCEDPPSHPAAKRQKRADKPNDTEIAAAAAAAVASNPLHEYTNASFQPVEPPSSAAGHRKNSHGSLASARPDWAPSMRSSNNAVNCASNVEEFRSTENLTGFANRNRRRKRSGTFTQARPTSIVDLTSSKEDADELSPPDPAQARHAEIPGEALGRRFAARKDQSATASAPPGSAKRKKGSPEPNTQPKRQRKFANSSGYDEKQASPDPLTYAEKPPKGAELHKPRAPVSSPNESTRGHIQPTAFRTSAKGVSKKANRAVIEETNREADRIVGTGLCVKRSVSGPYWFEEGAESSTTKCFLKIKGPHTILHAVDDQGNFVDCLQHFAVNVRRLKKVSLSQHGEHPIASMFQIMDTKSNSGAKLHLEFSGMEDLENFKKWLNVAGFDAIEKGDDLYLIKIMEKAMEDATNRRNKTHGGTRGQADTNGPLPDDLQLIQNKRKTGQPAVQNNPQPEGPALRTPKIKDSMKRQAPLQHEGGPVESRTSLGSRHTSPAASDSGKRTGSVDLSAVLDMEPARSTRSRANKRTPTQSPNPPGWTEMHPEWVNEWRNSIVFPAQGKNRATVDKVDIYRLDEGEFLNDNLIIFYFRYLQQRLEVDSPDLAKRIYFHNTFFFEKLKPDRTSADIRFDSVKNWTSRVDLFTKDFIIVPINEHSHWYVAIICNAPKLVPSRPPPQSADSKVPVVEPDSLPADSKEDHGVSPLVSDCQVTSDLRHMSLDETVDKTAPETDDVSDGESKDSVSFIKASGDSDAVVGKAQPASAAAGRKKAPKKILAGGRKNDPNQPKIITLDSLGTPHSRACQFLKKYLVAELADKKGIQIEIPRALGMTAKSIPVQSNFCDCGLYVLGYIARFLENPDQFVNSLIAHEKMEWDFNPSALREEIRNLLFYLQKEQQESEDAHKKDKAARAKMGRGSRPQSSQSRDGNQSPAQQTLSAALQEHAVVDSESVQPVNMEPEVRKSIEDASLRGGVQTVLRVRPGSHSEQHPISIGSSLTAQQDGPARSSTVETDQEDVNDTPAPGNRASGEAPATSAKGTRQSAGKPVDNSPRQSGRKEAKTSPGDFMKPIADSSPHGSSADRPLDVDDTAEHGISKHPKLTPGKRSRTQGVSNKEPRGQRQTKMNSSHYFGMSKKTPPEAGMTTSAKMLNKPINPMVIEDD